MAKGHSYLWRRPGRRDEERKQFAALMRKVEALQLRPGMNKTELAAELETTTDALRAWDGTDGRLERPPFRVLGYVASVCAHYDFTENGKTEILRRLVRDSYSGIRTSDVIFHPSISDVLESDYEALPPDYRTECGS